MCVCVCVYVYVYTGQAVPPGSHVRLNLQTGQREVRLGEEQLKYWTQEHRCGSCSTRKHDFFAILCTMVEDRQNVNIVCNAVLPRERGETQSTFSPDELKQAMKKIKEDLNPANKDPDPQVYNTIQ